MFKLANVSTLTPLGLPPAALEECKRQLGTKPKNDPLPELRGRDMRLPLERSPLSSNSRWEKTK